MANVVFSRLKGYNSVIPQSVFLGRFVDLNSNLLFFSFAYAKRLENITFILSRYPSHLAPSDLILALLYTIMAGLRRINKTKSSNTMECFFPCWAFPSFPISRLCDDSSRGFLPRLSGNWSPCTISFEPDCLCFPEFDPL